MVIIAGALVSSGHVSAQSCNANTNIGDLVSKCEKFVLKPGPPLTPSKECCEVVKNANVSCLCSLLTKKIQDFISMEKVVNAAKSCGSIVPPGTKCGSYTFPGA